MATYDQYRHMLIHRPERQWKQDPNILHDKLYSTDKPTFSIVMPIHDQEHTIERVLANVLVNTLGYYEIIIILDGCEDNTKNIVLNWLNQIFPSSLTRIRILENIEGIFEASCDNQGFVLSDGKYIVEVQADMQIMTFGYNIILATPLEIYDDIIGISGRCCHGINGNSHYIADGKVGELIDNPHSMKFSHFNIVTLSHSANRGPLVLRKSMLHELGYLDEEHYPLDASDHDLFMRAWRDRAWRCGFVPVEFYSPQSWGSTRKVRNDDKSKYLSIRESKMTYGYFNQNSTTFKYPDAEIRRMEWNRIRYARDILINPNYTDNCNLDSTSNSIINTMSHNHTQIINRQMGEGNYGTHMAPLITAVMNTRGDVFEMGCGDFSTPLLHAICKSTNRYLLSTDTSKDWISLFLDLESKNHEFIYVPVYDNDWDLNAKPHLWDSIGNQRWSVVFIDHRPAERRNVDIERFANTSEIIVVHDTEHHGYKYEPVLSKFKYRYDYKRYNVYTTLVSNFIDVSKFF